MTGGMEQLSSTVFLVSSSIKVFVVFSALMLVVAYATLAERRVSAFIQDRLGPNRVGPFGLLQPIADGLKNLLKEETAPAEANRRSGSGSRQRRIVASQRRSRSGISLRGEAGRSRTRLSSTSMGVPPVCGRDPVTSSCRITPSA